MPPFEHASVLVSIALGVGLTRLRTMPIYYRFQHEQPTVGEEVHCFTNLERFRGFVRMMRGDDPDFRRMKLWEINGKFVLYGFIQNDQSQSSPPSDRPANFLFIQE